jgi:hypothetical protein
MSKFGFVLAVSSLCCGGCQPSRAITELPGSIEIQLPAETVELGVAFPLTVVQVKQKKSVESVERGESVKQAAASFNQNSLPPLVLQLLETDLRRSQGLVRVQNVYRAYCFEPGLHTWPQYGLQIEVLASLDAKNPGSIELPGDVLPLPRSWTKILGRGAAALLLLIVLQRFWRRRLRRKAAEKNSSLADNPQVHPADRALQRLQELARNPCTTQAQIDAYFVEISNILRLFLVEQFAVPALEMTTEQLHGFLQKHPFLVLAERQRLDQVLNLCDQVKFAGLAGGAARREQASEFAGRFLDHSRGIDA